MAEIAWRWAFGACALAMVAMAALQLLRATLVTPGDAAAFRGHDSTLMALAVLHVWQHLRLPLLRLLLVVIPTLTLLWIVLASIGRAAVLPLLVEVRSVFRRRSIFAINALRAVWMLAAGASCLLAIALASLAAARFTPDPYQPNLPLYFLLVLVLLPVILIAWSTLNWLLSLAPIFCVRQGATALDAITEARRAVGGYRPAFSALSLAYGALRLLVLLLYVGTTTLAGSLAAQVLGMGAAWAVVILLSLIYFVVADFIYVARLAAYVAILSPQAEDKPPEHVPSAIPVTTA